MCNRTFSWDKTILPEIKKCRLLCANCHRTYSKKQIIWRKKNNFTVPKKIRLRPHYHNVVEQQTKHTRGDPLSEKEKLYELVKQYSFVHVGKLFGVYSSTVHNWCKKYDLPYTHRKLNAEKDM